MSSTARRRAMEALKRQRAPAPAGPLFAVAEEGAEFEADALDKVAVLFPLPLPEPFDYRAPSSLLLEQVPRRDLRAAPVARELGVNVRASRGAASAEPWAAGDAAESGLQSSQSTPVAGRPCH